MVKRIFLSRLALFGSFFALGVIGLGAMTRLLDAGLGCPDWPGCYGQMTVSINAGYKAWAEMIHRYFVGGLSIFILSIIFVVFAFKKLRVRSNVILSVCLILLLIYQIMLGRWTVTLKLLPIVVTQHLLGGFFILTVLWLIYLNNKNKGLTLKPEAGLRKEGSHCEPASNGKPAAARLLVPERAARLLEPEVAAVRLPVTVVGGAYVGFILLLLQISLGAWTSTNYASLSCTDFPFCNNAAPFGPLYLQQAFDIFAPTGVNYEGGILSESVRQTIQMVHRLGALVLSLYLFIFAGFCMQKLKKYPELLKILYLLLGLLLLQICIGITNVLFKLPLVTAIAHNLVAVTLLLTLVTFIFKLRKVPT